VLPPDINASETDFTVVYAHPDGRGPLGSSGRLRDRLGPQIRFGLGAVRGVGEAALETMFDARRAGGPFRDLFDFASRVDAKRLNKGVLEALVQCGAFDSVLEPRGISRSRAFAAIDRALERSRSASRDRERGQTTLFGMFEQATPGGGASAAGDEYPSQVEEWDRMELLRREKAALGCYVSGHPMFRYASKLGRLSVVASPKVGDQDPWSMATVAGMIENYEEKLFKGGTAGRAAFFEVEDMHGRVKAKLRGDRIETYSHLLTSGDAVLVSGKVSFKMTEEPDEEREPTLLVDQVELLSEAALRATRGVTIRLDAQKTERSDLVSLKELLDRSPGPCPVELVLALGEGAEAVLDLSTSRVAPSDALLGGLERVFGDAVAELR
jgi:DNA polymerase-3 subunit alpha